MWKGKQTGKDMEVEERYFRVRDHEFPFSSPVNMAHGYGCPHEQDCYRGACAVVRPNLFIPCSSMPWLVIEFADTGLGCIWVCRACGTIVKLHLEEIL